MSVEFRVAVPKGRRADFEKAIQKVKEAKVLKVTARSPKDALVRRHRRQHLEILDRLQQPKPIGVQAKINEGYKAFLEDVAGEDTQPSVELTNARFKSIVNHLLEETRNSEPVLVDTVQGHIQWSGIPLDPKQAQGLIYRYGLLDGEIRSGVDTLRVMGYSPKSQRAARHMLSWSLDRVYRYLGNQGLLVPKS